MYEQLDTSVPRKHRDRGNWSTTKTRHVHRVVYSFNTHANAGISSSGLRPARHIEQIADFDDAILCLMVFGFHSRQ